MGCYIWYSEEARGRATAPPSPLLAVSNVTAHPSTASVPTLLLLLLLLYFHLCYSTCHCSHLCTLKGYGSVSVGLQSRRKAVHRLRLQLRLESRLLELAGGRVSVIYYNTCPLLGLEMSFPRGTSSTGVHSVTVALNRTPARDVMEKVYTNLDRPTFSLVLSRRP